MSLEMAKNIKSKWYFHVFSFLLGFYGNAISLSWSERLRGRLHSALAEVWSEGTQCDQNHCKQWPGGRHCENGHQWYQWTSPDGFPRLNVLHEQKRLTVWHTMPRKNEREQQRSSPKNAHGRNLHQIGLLQWLLNWRCHAHRHFREFSENYHMEHTLNILQ